MAEPDLLAPFADLPFPPGDDFPDFPALGDDAFALEDFDLEDLDFDFDVDLFPPDAPPPVTTSSSSAAGSPEAGTSSTGDGGSKNEESADSSSPSRSGSDGGGGGSGKDGKDDEAKRRARLVRNRESAHQSRQRKKQYVEELEGKVKVMQATIADLTARISCVTAENAALKQQLSGTAGAGAAALPPPMPMYPAVYPLPMPWIHPAYAMRGSQVPLVPIPRLKTQLPASTPEPPAKKARKTKKVAGVSLLGLLFLMMVCGCLVPAVNRMYGAAYTGEGAAIVPSHHGRILAVEGPQNSVSNGVDPKVPQNGSETLPALLYLPRNGKHVKINGNLVIKSIVASEKASSRLSNYGGKGSGNQEKEETSLAIPGYVAPLEAGEVMDSAFNELMALAPGDGSIYREDDGMLPQWFSEAMSGPMLNSGMCTEVFQFDLSPTTADANGIVPVYSGSVTNTSQNYTENLPSGPVQKVKNRRISYSEAIPLRGLISNDTDHFKAPPKNHSQSHAGRKPVSSVVVSVLADPREASDRDGEGRISSNSVSRIFVVVLIDSVKYVTYSCVLPFKSHSPHL
ncbi:bZIP transcription factor 60 [Oryza glaberrima]|uniref:BZIP domain-containing protein n=1 Tax=Oryza glaberrima TaxID=4538 RepID=I1QCN2_ORYGL|nr:bZIP transcription factor 60 [Oryza glaberrima]